jgi:hypothetical protein
MMLNPTSLALVGLRAAALALDLQGQKNSARSLYWIADAAEAGKDVDAHMEMVGQMLRTRAVTEADWADVIQRVEADSDRLQSPV